MNKLEKIETFITLAECQSFSEAAKRLYCSQPTISHHIQQLEEHFDTQLFDRSGKSIQITQQGELLLQYAKKISDLWEEASLKMKNTAPQEQTLSVFVSQYIAGHFFSTITDPFHSSFPHTGLEINSYCYDDLKSFLLSGKINFALMPIYPRDDYVRRNCEISVLFHDEFQLVFANAHPWRERKMIYARDLSGETVLLPRSRFLQQCIKDPLDRHKVRVRYLQMSNFDVIRKAVQSGHGIAFLPQAAVKDAIEGSWRRRLYPLCCAFNERTA